MTSNVDLTLSCCYTTGQIILWHQSTCTLCLEILLTGQWSLLLSSNQMYPTCKVLTEPLVISKMYCDIFQGALSIRRLNISEVFFPCTEWSVIYWMQWHLLCHNFSPSTELNFSLVLITSCCLGNEPSDAPSPKVSSWVESSGNQA